MKRFPVNDIVLKVLALLLLTAAVLMSAHGLRDRPFAEDVTGVLDDKPHRVPPLVRPLFSEDSSEACLVDYLLPQSACFPTTVSGLCHLLRVHGLGTMPHGRFSSGQEVVRVLTDVTFSQEVLQQALLFETRDGVRYRLPLSLMEVQEGGENHQDLVLATFAELGLPLSTPIRMKAGLLETKGLLRDSIAHFTRTQEEIAWTAMAYALYLPPRTRWTNRDGESFTLDDLAMELMNPNRRGSCGGLHLLSALTLLLRVDAISPCLRESTRQAIRAHLQERVSSAVASQATEGSWTFAWDGTHLKGDTPTDRLLITGHLMEWMQHLPEELQPPAEVYRRAANWLCSQLASDPLESRRFCPWTHAVRSIRNLIGEVSECTIRDSRKEAVAGQP